MNEGCVNTVHHDIYYLKNLYIFSEYIQYSTLLIKLESLWGFQVVNTCVAMMEFGINATYNRIATKQINHRTYINLFVVLSVILDDQREQLMHTIDT